MANKRVGIIGGVGPTSTVLYYQGIIEGYFKRTGSQHFPEILIYSLDLAEIKEYFEKTSLDALTKRLINAVKGLEATACNVGLFACNAMHIVFDQVQQQVSLPLLNIIQTVMQDLKRKQVRIVGLLGGAFVMRTGIYRQPLELAGIRYLLPDEKEQAWIVNVIRDELQHPNISQHTVMRLLENVEKMRKQGAEGVILGCTDLPVAITARNSILPLFDSTKLHVEAILDWVIEPNDKARK